MGQLLEQRELIRQTFIQTFTPSKYHSTSTNSGNTTSIAWTKDIEFNKVLINVARIGVHSKLQTLPFLLTFEIFNNSVHSCLVYYGASTNVKPWPICKNINATPEKNNSKIIQLEQSEVQVISELNDVLI